MWGRNLCEQKLIKFMNLCLTGKLWFEAKSLYVASSRKDQNRSCSVLPQLNTEKNPKPSDFKNSNWFSFHLPKWVPSLFMDDSCATDEIKRRHKGLGYDLQVAESLCARCQMPVVSNWGWNYTWDGWKGYAVSKCKHRSSVSGCQRHTLFRFGWKGVLECFNNDSSCDTLSSVGGRLQNLFRMLTRFRRQDWSNGK